jgi:hypothetical protein
MARTHSTLRRIGTRLRRRGDSPRPDDAPGDVELLNRAPDDEAFITGNGFAARCRWVRNYGPPYVNDRGRRDWYFCKPDHLDWFFRHEAPREDFVLVSHNSDIAIGEQHLRFLRHRRLRAWFAANVELEHPKLRAIPLGIANPHWPHGDAAVLEEARAAALPKSRLVDASFSVDTNVPERSYCVQQTGLEPSPALPFTDYVRALTSSYFSLCPRGNGIDTHRTWEALYLRTIPIVTRSPLTEQHPDLPLLVLDDWSQFRSLELSPEVYSRIWGNWDTAAIRLDRYAERLARAV